MFPSSSSFYSLRYLVNRMHSCSAFGSLRPARKLCPNLIVNWPRCSGRQAQQFTTGTFNSSAAPLACFERPADSIRDPVKNQWCIFDRRHNLCASARELSTQTSSKPPFERPKFEVDAYTGLREKGPTKQKPYKWLSLKSRHKRAGNLLNQLNTEAMIECEKHRPIPYFRSGDAIEVSYKSSSNARHTMKIRGVVVGRKNAGLGSSFRIICVVQGHRIEYNMPVYSPLIQNIKFIQRAYIYRGQKRVRRSKLYYLENVPQRVYTISDAFIESQDKVQESRRNRMAAGELHGGILKTIGSTETIEPEPREDSEDDTKEK